MKFKNKLLMYLLYSVIILALGLYGVFHYINDYNINLTKYNLKEEYKDICEIDDIDSLNPGDKDICENIYPYEDGFMYSHSFLVVSFFNIIVFVILILVLAFSILNSSILLKNRIYINKIIREKYTRVINKMYRDAYVYIIPIILMLLIVFLIEIFNFGFDNTYSIINNTSLWNTFSLRNPLLFIFFYIINVSLYIAIYINVGLISVRKYKNYFSSLITSVICIIIMQLIVEIFIKKQATISFINIFRFNDGNGFYSTLIFPLIVWIASSVLTILVYANKEKLVNDYSANEGDDI